MLRRIISRGFKWVREPQPNIHDPYYYLDPKMTEDRLLRLVSLHDCVEGIQINLNKSFEELNVDPLSKVEIFFEIEKEFNIEIPDKVIERFINFEEVKEYLSKSFHTI